MELFKRIVKQKDRYLAQHHKNVMEYSKIIAEQKCPDMLDIVTLAAEMHDIGKICIPSIILQKSKPLSKREWALMKHHPLIGAELISLRKNLNSQEINNIHTIVKAVRHHHEKFDGSGYPDGLIGYSIPLTARIIAIADSFDAMTTDRPYRKAFSISKALEIINLEKGKQFDPVLVDIFTKATEVTILKTANSY